MIAVLFVVTAAAGTLLRWQASMSVPIRAIATFVVNIGGAFALGLLSTASADSQLIGGVAGIGALTTFSTKRLWSLIRCSKSGPITRISYF